MVPGSTASESHYDPFTRFYWNLNRVLHVNTVTLMSYRGITDFMDKMLTVARDFLQGSVDENRFYELPPKRF